MFQTLNILASTLKVKEAEKRKFISDQNIALLFLKQFNVLGYNFFQQNIIGKITGIFIFGVFLLILLQLTVFLDLNEFIKLDFPAQCVVIIVSAVLLFCIIIGVKMNYEFFKEFRIK